MQVQTRLKVYFKMATLQKECRSRDNISKCLREEFENIDINRVSNYCLFYLKPILKFEF